MPRIRGLSGTTFTTRPPAPFYRPIRSANTGLTISSNTIEALSRSNQSDRPLNLFTLNYVAV